MTNPFSAAISTLIDRMAALTEKASYESERERQALLDEAAKLRVGWCVLEAAGKITSCDRIAAEDGIATMAVRKLLAALAYRDKQEAK